MFTGKKKGLVGVMAVVLAGAMIVPLLAVSSATASTRVSHALPAPPSVTPSATNTIYTSGTMYGPPNVFNPNESGSYATGTEGLLYETLWLYDPVKNDYIPWLARAGKWVSPTIYRISLRPGVTWADGTPLTATDVAFTINLAKTDPGIYYSNLAADIASVTVNSPTSVTVKFHKVSAEDWQTFLYEDPILPQHIMGSWSNIEMNTGSNPDPVGSGPMLVDDSLSNLTQVCYYNNPKWWATTALHLSFKFTYLCDELNSSNNVELEDMLAGELTLSNNFLAGIAALISSAASTGNLSGKGGYGGFLTTYFVKPPYMLSANTTWLEPNLSKFPTNNLYFREAVAEAINEQAIVSVDYSDLVTAANPTGVMPSQSSYIDTAAVKAYGFSYNPKQAKADLAKSGYKGQKVTIECPTGWTDWMAAEDLIAQNLKAVGINAEATFPSYTARQTDLTDGTYDFALDNNASIAADPYNYFYREFRLPILKQQTAQDNWERDKNPTAWALVQKLNATPMSDKSARQGIFNQLETIELQTLPEIPLWYNGAWAQYNTTNWKDWPHANTADDYTPLTWRGWLGNMTTVLALAALQPK